MENKAVKRLNEYRVKTGRQEKVKRSSGMPISMSLGIGDQLEALIEDLGIAILTIANKVPPAPVIKNEIPEGKAPIVNISPAKIEVNVPKFDLPAITNLLQTEDYREALEAIKASVDALTEAINARPRTWRVTRDRQGFIEGMQEEINA